MPSSAVFMGLITLLCLSMWALRHTSIDEVVEQLHLSRRGRRRLPLTINVQNAIIKVRDQLGAEELSALFFFIGM